MTDTPVWDRAQAAWRGEAANGCPPVCAEAHTYSGSCLLRAAPSGEPGTVLIQRSEPEGIPEEPPLTPEEEEEMERLQCCNGNAEECTLCTDPNPPYPFLCPGHPQPDIPPQPVRRPPYAVAYSVDGHLYEVALPGDATVQAIDGHLIIRHGTGQVAGIVGIQPISNQETS